MAGMNGDEGPAEIPPPSGESSPGLAVEPLAGPLGRNGSDPLIASSSSPALQPLRTAVSFVPPALPLTALKPDSGLRNVPAAPVNTGLVNGANDGVWRRFVSWWNGRQRQKRARKEEAEVYSTVVVERDDSLAAICGKLDTTRRAQVAVVVPRGNHELSRPLGIRRLMRHADLSGKDVVLVTRNLSIRQRAHAEGQALTGSLRRVRFERLQPRGLQLGGLDLALPGFGTLVGLAAFGLFLGLAFIAVFWYLPVATITLYPRSTLVTKAQPVTFDSQVTRVNLAGFVVPAVRRQIDVSRTLYLPATGSIETPQANGQPLSVPVVSDKDWKFAQDLATPALRDQGTADLKGHYGAMDVIFPESAQVQVISIESVQKIGEASTFLQVTVRGSVSMLAASNDDLRQVFLALLRSQVRNDQAFIESSFKTAVQSAGPYDRSADKLSAQIEGRVNVTRALDDTSLRHDLEGKSRRDAGLYLDRIIAPVQSPNVKLAPGWVPWIPRTGKHIHFDLRATGASQ
ncbi:MAG: hypothetical protein ACR2PL_09495 [Dehalococcoidia bacterium]